MLCAATSQRTEDEGESAAQGASEGEAGGGGGSLARGEPYVGDEWPPHLGHWCRHAIQYLAPVHTPINHKYTTHCAPSRQPGHFLLIHWTLQNTMCILYTAMTFYIDTQHITQLQNTLCKLNPPRALYVETQDIIQLQI